MTKKSTAAVSGAETGLVGIKLFDTGLRIVSVFGSPDSIEAVTLGGGSAGPGGGGAGGGRGGAIVGGGGKGGGAPMNAPIPPPPGGSSDVHAPNLGSDFGFGDGVLDRQGKMGGQGGMNPGSLTAPGQTGSGPMKGGGGNNGGAGGVGASDSDRVTYTRWIYNRNASKYAFILDKFDHVIQCEAIGIQPGRVKTRRGVTFGSSFATILKKYGAPDGYEISGDNIVVRYLSKDKCAFRLSRLGENTPSVVTGIVVAAGKR
ncbi:MAG TPA: hypothetical protein VHE55_19180 [Fimbriimonadaceae bacterium]|nr:hypothetical protein [Fimbriimonadaceae bacterium]